MPFRHQLILGYLIIFFIMIVIAAVTYQGISSSIRTARWVVHTHEVISQGNLIQTLLIDMETGQRGFSDHRPGKFLGALCPWQRGLQQTPPIHYGPGFR